MEYRVSWIIDIEAGGPVAAARCAQQIQRDAASWATVFTVENVKTGGKRDIDLSRWTQNPAAKGGR